MGCFLGRHQQCKCEGEDVTVTLDQANISEFSNYRFARRSLAVPPNVFAAMDAKVAQAKQAGVDVIDLSKANPDIGAPEFIVRAGQKAMDSLPNHRYTPFDGKPGFLAAAQGWYEREHGVHLDWHSQIIATVGAIDGLSTLTQVLLDPGDTVLVPDPYYPPYAGLVAAAEANLIPVPTSEGTGFLPDLEALPDETWDNAKLFLLNYPNNPTGALATPEFYERLVAKARRHHVLIVNDFAYAGLGVDSTPLSLLSVAGADNVAIEVVSLSKMYGMAGWRLGFVAAPAEVMEVVRTYHHQIRSFPTGSVQDAGQVALSSDQSSVRELSRLYQRRREILSDGLDRAGLPVFRSPGALFVWAAIPKGWKSEDFADALLAETGVAVMPGIYFGKAGEGYIRLSLLDSESELRRAVERIAESPALAAILRA